MPDCFPHCKQPFVDLFAVGQFAKFKAGVVAIETCRWSYSSGIKELSESEEWVDDGERIVYRVRGGGGRE